MCRRTGGANRANSGSAADNAANRAGQPSRRPNSANFRVPGLPLSYGHAWGQVYATSCLAGIGFTMSFFIANLGFGEGESLQSAKIGILAGSLIAGVAGYVLLRITTRKSEGVRS